MRATLTTGEGEASSPGSPWEARGMCTTGLGRSTVHQNLFADAPQAKGLILSTDCNQITL